MTRPLKPFVYFEPSTIKEAVQILDTYGTKAKVLAGGVDLVARMRLRQIRPEYVVSILNIPKLDYIQSDGAGLKFGALVTIRSLELSPKVQKNYAILYEAASQIASVQVKNMGTAVGNLCVATPASDIAAALYALSAKLRIISPVSERVIPIEEFFIGVNQTVLKPGEIVTEVIVPSPAPQTGGAFFKLVRTTSDIAKVNVAVSLTVTDNTCREARVALGSVAPTVIRANQAEEALKRSRLEPKAVEEAAQLAAQEAKPITDLRSTVEYRSEMVRVLVRRAMEKALTRVRT
ncbi:MAG: xanthine dehydrogenase family protein subunit M [Dehalococcoidia bacterium]|nr:xanthine dehydrogenase family protein subunit M [Dehalococcoidia bacterium]